MSRLRRHYFEADGLTTEQLSEYAQHLIDYQRSINFWIGDAAIQARKMLGENWTQVFPVDVSPGLVARCEAVARAYPKEEDRDIPATWTQYMQQAKRPDRQDVLERLVDEGKTSDESRPIAPTPRRHRWLLAIDVHYHLHRHWYWEHKYKDRPPKDPELVQQLTLVRELLDGAGFLCVSVDGFEADDVIATYAAKFDGKVTILSQDKDLKQCLSDSCNMLLDVEWTEDFTSGEMIPEYKWLSAGQHTEDTGIDPNQWPDYQAIMGDNVDGIRGAEGIGAKGAADLIKEFQTLGNVLVAARAEHKSITPKKREALLEFAKTADVVRKLVTLRTDVPVSGSTLLV